MGIRKASAWASLFFFAAACAVMYLAVTGEWV